MRVRLDAREKSRRVSTEYGQSTGVVVFDECVRALGPGVLCRRVGAQWLHDLQLCHNHHRHSCIAARAGFGDLLIGAGALMCEANGFDPGEEHHLRDQMVELYQEFTEGFYACGVAASVYVKQDEAAQSFVP